MDTEQWATLTRIEDLCREVEAIISDARDFLINDKDIRVGDLDAMVQNLQFAADLVDTLMPEER
jgi:uncharacterized protein (DUF2164 family)